ncbi:MAG: serine hydrolase [Bacteroidota bacterium]
MKYFSIILLLLVWQSLQAQDVYFPATDGGNWETTDPTTLGWCTDSIEALYDFLEEQETKSFLVLKDGRIVLEQYFGTYVQDSLYPWFSAGKSLRAVLVGIAQEEGALDIQSPTSDYLGLGWTDTAPEQEDSITVWHQLTMTTGLNELIFTCTSPACLRYRAPAGGRWAYHNGPYSLTKDVLEEATGISLNAYTNLRIENKLGMDNGFWLPAGDNTFYLSKARDMARFGWMISNDGYWNGEAILSDTAYFNQMLRPSQQLNPSYGYLWWLNGQPTHIGPDSPISMSGAISPHAPDDVVLAAGANGQFISVSKSTGIVMIRQGNSSDESFAPINLHDEIWRRLNELACGVSSVTERSIEPLNVYPNPTYDVLTIPGIAADALIQVYDLQGRRVLRAKGTNRLAVGHLSPGHYRVVVSEDGVVRAVAVKVW